MLTACTSHSRTRPDFSFIFAPKAGPKHFQLPRNILLLFFFDILSAIHLAHHHSVGRATDADWRAEDGKLIKSQEREKGQRQRRRAATKTWNSNLESQWTCFRLYVTSFSSFWTILFFIYLCWVKEIAPNVICRSFCDVDWASSFQSRNMTNNEWLGSPKWQWRRVFPNIVTTSASPKMP